MPIATQSDIEAIRGPRYIATLLKSAVDTAADAPTQAAQRQARLDAGLLAGDNLIRQFLDLDALTQDPIALATIRQFAIEEAIYFLQSQSETKPSEHDDERARMRRADLAMMRKREQFPGTATGQAVIPSGVVTNTLLTDLRGYY